MHMIYKTAFILTVIGALNWGLVGFFDFNLVGFLLGDMSLLARLVYAVVGVSAILVCFGMLGKTKKTISHS